MRYIGGKSLMIDNINNVIEQNSFNVDPASDNNMWHYPEHFCQNKRNMIYKNRSNSINIPALELTSEYVSRKIYLKTHYRQIC